MCSYGDFDWYVEWTRPEPYSPDSAVSGRSCDCGHRPVWGEHVRVFGGRESPEDPCPWCSDLEWWDGDGRVPVVDDYGHEVQGGLARPCHVCQGTGEDLTHVVEHVEFFCDRCDAARELLDVWCDGNYSWGEIPRQIVDHWHEDEICQSVPFGSLVELARSNWRDGSERIPVAEVERLAAESLSAVRP